MTSGSTLLLIKTLGEVYQLDSERAITLMYILLKNLIA